MAKKSPSPVSPTHLEAPGIDKLREMVAEYGQRGTSRMTGIPRTTIQGMLKTEKASRKWEPVIELEYRQKYTVNQLQKQFSMPPAVSANLVNGTTQQMETALIKWQKIKTNIEKTAWMQYQQRLEVIKLKVINGQKITAQQRKMLRKGSGAKIREEVKKRAINNLQYTEKTFQILDEIYGRIAR